MKFKVECLYDGATWRESMNSGLCGKTFATEALAQSAIESFGSRPLSSYRIVVNNLPSPPTAPIIQRVSISTTLRELLLKGEDMKINESVFRPLFEKYCMEGTRPYLYVLGRLAGGEYISQFTEDAWQNYRRGLTDYMAAMLGQLGNKPKSH